MKKCLITTVIGNSCSRVSKLTLPLMEDFAKRHNYEFFTLTNLFGHTGPHWVRLECERFLKSDFHICLYSDIDVVFELNAPDLIGHIDRDQWDVAGTREPSDSKYALDVATYAKRSKLRWPLPDLGEPYICSGLVVYNRGFLNYFSEPKLPEIKGKLLNDQNALNYAIMSGRIRCGLFPHGWGGCPGLYCGKNDTRFFHHFHGSSMDAQYTNLANKVMEINNAVLR